MVRSKQRTLPMATGLFLVASTFGCGPTETLEEAVENPDAIEEEAEAGRLEPIEVYKDGTVTVGVDWYDSVTSLHRSARFVEERRRCASDDNMSLYAFRDPGDCSFNQSSNLPEYQPGAIYEIPVVFHVIERSDGAGAIEPDLLLSQIDVLNEDFQALAGSNGANGVNATIRFVLASTDPDGNPTNGIEYIQEDSYFTDPGPGRPNPMKEALNWDPTRYFNIYTNDASGALGYATFPQQDAGRSVDGIVLLWTSVGKNSPNGGDFNLGRTGTHEAGHYLGLFHTFQDGCDSGDSYTSGDLIADTVNHDRPNFSCSENGPSACGNQGNNPVTNYMNYTEDACMERFSPEQANRMRCSMIHYREGLFRIVGGGENQLPVAKFEIATNGLDAVFEDRSSDPDGDVVAWEWQFGDGTTSNSQNPFHAYQEAGTYLVSLVVTDNDGGSATSTQEITVSTGGPDPIVEIFDEVPVTDLSAPKGGELHFVLSVPANASRLSFVLKGDGDADMHIRIGAQATLDEWDYRPYEFGSNETVDVSDPASDKWYVMLHAYTDFSNVELVAHVETATAQEGQLLINEILADPDTFDSNGDGTAHYEEDEFLELLNIGGGDLDLSGAVISDAVGPRFTFPEGTVLKPGGVAVVFGGGVVPSWPNVQTFASLLQLNNRGDVITIQAKDGRTLAAVSYGREGSQNQSIVREIDGTESAFVPHRQLSDAPASPGKRSDGSSF